jgi:hypothetical protein
MLHVPNSSRDSFRSRHKRLGFSHLTSFFISGILPTSLFPTSALGLDVLVPADATATPTSADAAVDTTMFAYAAVGTAFTGTILMGGVQVPCTYEVTGAGAVQIGDGSVCAISDSLAGDLTIPASVTYDGESYAVTAVGHLAFYGCTSLTSTGLATNSTVVSIGQGAFDQCVSLTSTGLESNSTVASINGGVFWGCTSLKSTGLESNSAVVSLDDQAFSYCTSLVSTGLESNSTVASIGYEAFYGCASLSGRLVLGPWVASVGAGAFAGTGYTAACLLAPDPASVQVGSRALSFAGGAVPLHVPASWAGTSSFSTGTETYSVADGSLVVDAPLSPSGVSAARSSARSASVSFTSSTGDAVPAALPAGLASAALASIALAALLRARRRSAYGLEAGISDDGR